MRVAIVGSRKLKQVDISQYIPEGTTVVVSGGAYGIDTLAEKYANEKDIPKLIIKPDYDRYGNTAPLERNKLIVDNSDVVIAIWDGKSTGTMHTVRYARKMGKPVKVYTVLNG